MLQGQRAVLSQSQKLKMSPQLFQAINIMALPLPELREKIYEELERNPALEKGDEIIKEDNSKEPELANEEKRLSLDREHKKEDGDSGYEYFSRDDNFESEYHSNSSEDSKRAFLEGAFSREQTLQEYLIWQLHMQPLKQEELELGELLIQNLNDDGFYIEDPDLFCPKEKKDLLQKMCSVIQRLDPQGVCTADYQESLRVQLEINESIPQSAKEIVLRYLNLFKEKKFTEIARMVREQEESDLSSYLKQLNPFPGRQYAFRQPDYVVPELSVRMEEGELRLYQNDDQVPALSVSADFEQWSSDRKTEKQLKNFAKTWVKEAQWFIQSIQQRNQTLLKVGAAILEFQRDFFKKGPRYLVPMILKDVANEIGVHETTVSRITNGKYIQTEWGIFELKYFFSSSVPASGSSSKQMSKQGVKEIIREILEAEQQKGKRLSDQKISDLLKNRGINLARRTVTKYRKELDIMSSFQR